MQEAEEQDTCRICSAPGEPNQPLFHPCKCSGTIRYIHQDCLTTWLSHSKKKTCDLCKHPYSFTKVYASDMPATLPPLLLIRRLAQQAFFASLFGLRAILIALVWLALLPWITIWTWRVYFTMGESTAWWISGRQRNTDIYPIGLVQTLTAGNETVPSLRNATVLHRLTSRAFWHTLSSDVFAGQIIASLIVLVFVAVFLLREWISQNARPGMFEDEDLPVLPPQELPPVNPPPVDPPLGDLNGHVLAPPRLAPLADDGEVPQPRLWMPNRPPGPLANPAFEGLRRRGDGERLGLARDPIQRPGNPPPPGERLVALPPPPPVPAPTFVDLMAINRGKGKAREAGEDVEFESAFDLRRRIRRRMDADNQSIEVPAEGSSSLSVTSGFTPQRPLAASSSGPPLEAPFEFTFRPPQASSSDIAEDVFEPVPEVPGRSLGALQDSVLHGSPVPEEGEHRPRSIVFGPEFSIHSLSSRSPTPDDFPHYKVLAAGPPPSSPSPSNLSTPPSPSSSYGVQDSTGTNGMASEYFASQPPFGGIPSDLPEPGSSSSSVVGNVEGKKRTRDEMEEKMNDYDLYFRDPRDDARQPLGFFLEEVVPRVDEDGTHLPQEVHEDDEEESESGDEDWDRVFFDADMEREDDEDEDEDAVDIGEINVPNRIGLQAPPVQPVAAVEPLNEPVDDLEAGVEDDMEGALEAIGLRGPIFGVVQNVILMVFVLDTAIGFGVWLPFTLGKTAALLSLDPQRALFILHLPIRAMRILTDPFVDFFTLVLGRFLFPFVFRTFKFLVSSVLTVATYFAGKLVPSPLPPSESHNVTSWVASVGSDFSTSASKWLQPPSQTPSPSLSQQINDFFESNSTVAQLLEPHFAYVGQEVRLFTTHFQESWIRLTLGSGSTERAFAIVLGYAGVGIALALYLNVFTVGNARTAGRAVRNAVRQQLLVVKVAMFIIIELIIFPLGCGIMLDACTVWVFPEASLQSRVAFFTQAPLTAMFYHWVAGTMFMYQFAVLLAGCRNIMRPGAMWFIKDPQDQNFHPIRDILDRPTFTQFRKLLISAFMYAMVVACGVGSLAILLFIGNRSIFPIRWKTREPLSEVPIDLLFLQIVLPYTMRHLRPRRVIYNVAVQVWKILAARLRLTSYMFGDRHPEEEYPRTSKTWFAFIRGPTKDSVDMEATRDGTFRRVPASDNIALPRDMRATAEVKEDGTPTDDTARALIGIQDSEAVKAKRNIKDDYIVVFFPPRFRMRIIAFVMAVWTIMAIVAAVCVSVPIQVGRRCFALFSPTPVHDGYAFLAGFYLLWACYLVAKAAENMDRHRQRLTGDGPRADFAVYFAKQSLLWVVKISYMAVFFGVVIPILLALVVDMYIVMPVRLTLHPNIVPTIRLVDMWSLGLVYCKIVLRLRRRLELPPQQQGALHLLLIDGWTNPDPRHATKALIIPVISSLLGMLLLPAAGVYVLREFLHLSLSRKFLFIHVYPGIFAVVGLSRTFFSAMVVLSAWSQSIRDKEFLVEMRLQNLEPGQEAQAPKIEFVDFAAVVRGERGERVGVIVEEI